VYTTADVETRERISEDELYEMDLLDNDGYEIPIFSATGYQIGRRIPVHDELIKPHGVLMDLCQLHQLFDDNETDDELGKCVRYHAYPQAGLVTAGHVQANGIVSKFQTRVSKLNEKIRMEKESDREEDEEEDHDVPNAIEGIAFQGYNVVMHCTRGLGSQYHDAQKGYVTGAISAAWVEGEGKAKTTGRDLLTRCMHQLPHERYDKKISNNAIERDLRLENVYAIDMKALPAAYRNGRCGLCIRVSTHMMTHFQTTDLYLRRSFKCSHIHGDIHP
jgi:hypothetical protein